MLTTNMPFVAMKNHALLLSSITSPYGLLAFWLLFGTYDRGGLEGHLDGRVMMLAAPERVADKGSL